MQNVIYVVNMLIQTFYVVQRFSYGGWATQIFIDWFALLVFIGLRVTLPFSEDVKDRRWTMILFMITCS